MDSLQYAIYKGMGGKYGAIQFSLQHPHFYSGKNRDYEGIVGTDENYAFTMSGDKPVLKDGWRTREGAVFLQIASAKGKNVYDWENKIIMALSVQDMGQILLSLMTGDECKIMHDPGAKSESQSMVKKYLNVTSKEGPVVGVIVSVTQVSGNDKKTHTVPISGSEVVVLKTLLQQAISRALGW